MRGCRLCGQEKDESEFYPQGKQCRACLAALSSKRYHGKWRVIRLAERRQKDLDRKAHARTVSDIECAYAAGLLDGEGCIHIRRAGVAGGTATRIGQYTMLVTVRSTSPGMQEFFRDRWGGTIARFDARPDLNRKAQSAWTVTANNALFLLDDVFPYLRVKRTQAKLARRFQRYVQVVGRKRTEKIRRVQHRFFRALKLLNYRGLRPPTL